MASSLFQTMKLTLQTITGTKYFLDADPHDKVRDVKVKIFKDLEIKNKVRLIWQSKPLEDTVTLAAQGIIEDMTLQMVIEPGNKMKLKIQTFKKGILSIELEDSNTVLDLQRELKASAFFLSSHVSDFYYEDICLSDKKWPFHLYGIVDGSVIVQNYLGSFSLKVENPLENAFLQYITVKGTDTISELKEKILNVINEDNDEDGEDEALLNLDEIIIFHEQIAHSADGIEAYTYDELDRDTLTVSQCKIKAMDLVTFIRYHRDGTSSADVKIMKQKSLKESKRVYRVHNPERVFCLKLKIQHQLQIPFEKQVMSIAGQSLDLDKKIWKSNLDKIVLRVKD